MSRPLRIGLTGGIGSGKSTAAGFFTELGVPVFDADTISRTLTAPGSPVLEEIRELFGDAVFSRDGDLDRDALREHIFRDAGKRKQLESILHPRVYRELERLTTDNNMAAYVLWVVPLLLETGATDHVDRILVIDCPEQVQLQRARERDQLSADQVRSIMEKQCSREQRLAAADDIIVNIAGEQDLKRQVGTLHEKYNTLSRSLKYDHPAHDRPEH